MAGQGAAGGGLGHGLPSTGNDWIGPDANGVIVGNSKLSDVSIPTMWLDDEPKVNADMIVPGPDRNFTNVEGINDSGAMVGEAVDSAGMTYSVLLRPE